MKPAIAYAITYRWGTPSEAVAITSWKGSHWYGLTLRGDRPTRGVAADICVQLKSEDEANQLRDKIDAAWRQGEIAIHEARKALREAQNAQKAAVRAIVTQYRQTASQ